MAKTDQFTAKCKYDGVVAVKQQMAGVHIECSVCPYHWSLVAKL